MNIDQALQEVDKLLKQVVTSDVDVLREASQHILTGGGKRYRPRLTLLAYLAAGGTDLMQAVPVAAAVELVHTATLVHDDINDHGSLRRGRPTVNAVYGRTLALLTGDFLFTKVYELMAPFKELNPEFAAATVALVEGETLQAAAAKNNTLDRETYGRIIAKKTAVLFAMAAKVGGMIAGAGEGDANALYNYGFNAGLAFQIVDDILDIIADSEKLGKTAGLDIAQGRGLVTALAHTTNGHTTGGAPVAVIEPEAPADPMEAFKQRMLSGGYIEEGRKQARDLADMAKQTLERFPASPAINELSAFADSCVERDH